MNKIIILIFTSLLITACDNASSEAQKILLSNNYNFVTQPEFTPNSKPTKKQLITTYSVDTNAPSIFSIESNSNGFITNTTEFDSNNKIVVDYNNLTTNIIKDETQYQYKVVLDDKGNIIKLLDLDNNVTSSVESNEKGRIIKMEGELYGKDRIEFYQYSDSGLIFYSIKNGNLNNNIYIGYKMETHLFYDKGLLTKSVTNRFLLVNNKKWQFSPENEKYKNNKETCFYSSHNQYGDWTEGYCENLLNEKTRTFTRTLEY
ncbi:hypothetical protein RCS94_01410 [Orbaceae bacterium ac157xtp]